MSYSKKLIKNAKVVNENKILNCDLLIHGNRINKITKENITNPRNGSF